MVGFFETEYALLTVPNIDRDETWTTSDDRGRACAGHRLRDRTSVRLACGRRWRKDEEVRLEIAVSTEFTSRRGCRPSLSSRLLALETAVRSTRSDRLASSI